MPRTRSAKPLKDEQAQAVPSDDDSGSPPTTASFKDRLMRFQYDSASISIGSVSLTPRPGPQSAKRPRTSASLATSTASSSPQPKKKRKPSKYADPAKYAHLSPLVDILEPNLVCVCVGTNPGVQTATAGHAYAHPSNHFWKLLYSSGMTDRRLKPEEDRSLPALYCIGNTNIVDRPSKDAAELSKDEMAAGTANLNAKFLKYKPEAILIVGKGIWEAIWRYNHGKNPKPSEFRYGWQDEKHNMGVGTEDELDNDGNPWKGSKVFVTTSTSGLAASLKPAEKEAIWKPFGEWVQQRRTERGFVPRISDTT